MWTPKQHIWLADTCMKHTSTQKSQIVCDSRGLLWLSFVQATSAAAATSTVIAFIVARYRCCGLITIKSWCVLEGRWVILILDGFYSGMLFAHMCLDRHRAYYLQIPQRYYRSTAFRMKKLVIFAWYAIKVQFRWKSIQIGEKSMTCREWFQWASKMKCVRIWATNKVGEFIHNIFLDCSILVIDLTFGLYSKPSLYDTMQPPILMARASNGDNEVEWIL